MTGRIDEVELVGASVLRLVIERDGMGLDRDATLALEVHRIEHLRGHFTLGETAADLDEAVSQCRLAVVDMGDDGKVADMAEIGHGLQALWGLKKRASVPQRRCACHAGLC
jgi:hypothetical protein